ncbi:serine/threonine-protein kinase prp4 isoform X1 [Selaginella moellendorffii]|uniref:serine/threonine-protein kinase prp4 isoform X1 n=1 Tax=Selaginella moellendorffii TaxID=88036 RepID=UPI000D1C5EA5|nr:serine/threonine-protein kinase prp4 isoform X1 [Selaginella moellendorffii]|eukprot:XP_024528049.1 serine/threonine-protein kinase prp4 isoform X1 [Selaginella moellendorffii]
MARDGRVDDAKDKSRKRKSVEDEQPSSKRREDDDGKRKHKHRKHKHRSSHRKHISKEVDLDVVPAAMACEAEDGEILEPTEDGIVLKEEGNGSSESEKDVEQEIEAPKSERGSPRRSRDGSPPRDNVDRKHSSPDRRHRGSSVDRKRRSRSKESVRENARHHSRVASPDRKRRRSRSRDRGDERSRRHAYSPDRRRRSRSREHDEREKYPRKRAESRDRHIKDDRGARDDERHYNRDRNRRDREELSEKQETTQSETIEREEENQDEYLERVAHQLAEQEEDIEKVKEESRKRRQAILEKHKMQQSQPEEPAETMKVSKPLTAAEPDSGEGIIDPSTPLSLGKSALPNGTILKRNAGGLGEGSPPKSEKPADMFCDIFGESPAEIRKAGTRDTLAIDTSGLTDNWDDADGYYTYRVGEVLDNRYEIASSHGRGVFSTVVRARDTKAGRGEPEEVAIKIIRSNETMFKAGQMELIILNKLAGADLENKRHCVRLLSSFEYRNHLCLVFESLHMNLREILKKFGRNIGISLAAVRSYARQLFTALKHLRNCGVLHCDIKPDNMLVNDSKNLLKLCDFGSAMFAGENEITPYLVSRFYRAPEIILGLPYDHALDMWSVGCCLYELYTGKVLFPGSTNNDMLRLHMELKGPFPKKMLRKAMFTAQHFDQDLNFHAIEEDPVTKKTINRMITNVKPKDISTLISSSGGSDEDAKNLLNFKLLLEKIFILDPEKRLTVSQALNHPFITK